MRWLAGEGLWKTEDSAVTADGGMWTEGLKRERLSRTASLQRELRCTLVYVVLQPRVHRPVNHE